VQPTVPSLECVGCVFSAQKRAPSDGKTSYQGLVGGPRESSMRTFHRRLVALLTTLGALLTLAIAGGASFKGW
jgi:hypothetical protein